MKKDTEYKLAIISMIVLVISALVISIVSFSKKDNYKVAIKSSKEKLIELKKNEVILEGNINALSEELALLDVVLNDKKSKIDDVAQDYINNNDGFMAYSYKYFWADDYNDIKAKLTEFYLSCEFNQDNIKKCISALIDNLDELEDGMSVDVSSQMELYRKPYVYRYYYERKSNSAGFNLIVKVFYFDFAAGKHYSKKVTIMDV